jgi:outer membrane lipoprotein-sorting protein
MGESFWGSVQVWYNAPESGGARGGCVRKAPAWVVLSLCAVVVTGCLSHRMTGVEVVNLAQQALSETTAFYLVLDIEIDTDLIKDSLSVSVWEKPPDLFKLQVLSAMSPQLRQLAFTTNGVQSKSYSPHSNEVIVGPADLVKMPSVLESLVRARREWIQSADAGKARVIARERREGLVVYRVEIPRGRSGSAQFWIDARDWLVRQVTYEDDYLGAGTIRVREVKPLNELSDDKFELQFPDGVPIAEITMEDERPLTLESAQMAVSFPLREPGYLPPDTKFLVAYQIDQNIAMVYEGAHSFTLVQGPNIGSVPTTEAMVISLSGQPAMLVQDERSGGLLLTWREDDLQFSLAGLLDQEELVRIAESLQ